MVLNEENIDDPSMQQVCVEVPPSIVTLSSVLIIYHVCFKTQNFSV